MEHISTERRFIGDINRRMGHKELSSRRAHDDHFSAPFRRQKQWQKQSGQRNVRVKVDRSEAPRIAESLESEAPELIARGRGGRHGEGTALGPQAKGVDEMIEDQNVGWASVATVLTARRK